MYKASDLFRKILYETYAHTGMKIAVRSHWRTKILVLAHSIDQTDLLDCNYGGPQLSGHWVVVIRSLVPGPLVPCLDHTMSAATPHKTSQDSIPMEHFVCASCHKVSYLFNDTLGIIFDLKKKKEACPNMHVHVTLQHCRAETTKVVMMQYGLVCVF